MNHLTHIWQLVVRHEQLFYTSRQVPQCMQQWDGLTLICVPVAELGLLCHPSMSAPGHRIVC